jgi:hypothetical protein
MASACLLFQAYVKLSQTLIRVAPRAGNQLAAMARMVTISFLVLPFDNKPEAYGGFDWVLTPF